ncbi:angiomotin-like [Schistocerca cancellata]|uniref:angiomotin-like n=1 Tax=Schistocerca cancellata TaxID=274614 RepID=UPI002119A18E|nr:angiomotin-like [Schistocerca cancellata]
MGAFAPPSFGAAAPAASVAIAVGAAVAPASVGVAAVFASGALTADVAAAVAPGAVAAGAAGLPPMTPQAAICCRVEEAVSVLVLLLAVYLAFALMGYRIPPVLRRCIATSQRSALAALDASAARLLSALLAKLAGFDGWEQGGGADKKSAAERRPGTALRRWQPSLQQRATASRPPRLQAVPPVRAAATAAVPGRPPLRAALASRRGRPTSP